MKNKITRRRFIETTLAGTAAVTMAPALSCNLNLNPFDPKGLPTRVLGNTGVKVPVLGFGCGSRWMAVEDDDEAALAVVIGRHLPPVRIVEEDVAVAQRAQCRLDHVRIAVPRHEPIPVTLPVSIDSSGERRAVHGQLPADRRGPADEHPPKPHRG